MKQPAFTLIELLITVSVMAVLTGLIMINLYGNLAKARDAKRKSDLRELKTSFDIYYNTYGMYPPSNGSWPAYSASESLIVGCSTVSSPTPCAWGDPWIQDSTTFMGTLPKDPSGKQYYYMRAPQGRLNYWLFAKLERDIDPDIATSQKNCEDTTSGFYISGTDPKLYVVCDAK